MGIGPKNKLLTLAEFAAARGAAALLSALPRYEAIRVSTALMRGFQLAMPRLRRAGMSNLERAFPENSSGQHEEILRQTFENLGRVLGELSQFNKIKASDLKAMIDFELDETARSLYERNKREGRGVLITTGHLGNWELLVLGFAALYEPISYLARELDNPKIEQMLTGLRTRYANNPINKLNSASAAVRLLRSGGILGVLADVNSVPKQGVFVPFFDMPACTSRGPAMLAIRSGALIFPAFCVWQEELKRYKFVHGRLLEPFNTGDLEKDVLETTAAYTAEIENIVRAYPGQYMWVHRRWKTKPKGMESIYD